MPIDIKKKLFNKFQEILKPLNKLYNTIYLKKYYKLFKIRLDYKEITY